MKDNLSQRPRIDVRRTGWDYAAEIIALIGAIAVVLIPLLLWADLPERIPRNFGFSGDPTAWSDRINIVFPTVIALAIYVGLTLTARIPNSFSYPWPVTEENAAKMYRLGRSMVIWLKALLIWMFLSIQSSQARVALGDADGIHPATIVFFLVGIHVVLGLFIYRAYMARDGESSPETSPVDERNG
jgi:hypothetical protein